MDTPGDAIASIFMMVLATSGYLLPAIIAKCRNHYNRGAIFVLTLLGGWTLVGWVIAMVWAMLRQPTRPLDPVDNPHPDRAQSVQPRPKPRTAPDNTKKVDIANRIADLLRIQLIILPDECRNIENKQGRI